MKAVLISIRPYWCELIAKGEKTIEVRKTKPAIEAPFKCFIYCTKDNSGIMRSQMWKHNNHVMNGKVIGEFICDSVSRIPVECFSKDNPLSNVAIPFTCLSMKQIIDYLGNGKAGYAWHISELKIYDESKELSEFGLNRAPQSWCYIEEENKNE